MLQQAVARSCLRFSVTTTSNPISTARTYATATRVTTWVRPPLPPPTFKETRGKQKDVNKKKTRKTTSPLVRIVDGFKRFKPITPGIRHVKMLINPHLWKGKPVRELTSPLRKKGGRNNTGRVTVRSRGGGHKRRLRTVDFHRTQPGPHDVIRIEYDPNRSAHIALIKSRDPKAEQPWSYILASEGLRAGDEVTGYRGGIPDGLVEGYVDEPSVKKQIDSQTEGEQGEFGNEQTSETALSLGILRSVTLKLGNVLPLRLIPPGTIIHNISLDPKGKACLVRSAGTFATMVIQEGKGEYCQVKLQSGEIRRIRADCCATIGKVSNGDWKGRALGKAGRRRWLGRRPHVRGMAMNARDHPHGGGRGKSKGNVHPSSPWGWNTKGKRTRKPGPRGHKSGNKFVIRERPRGRTKIALLVK